MSDFCLPRDVGKDVEKLFPPSERNIRRKRYHLLLRKAEIEIGFDRMAAIWYGEASYIINAKFLKRFSTFCIGRISIGCILWRLWKMFGNGRQYVENEAIKHEFLCYYGEDMFNLNYNTDDESEFLELCDKIRDAVKRGNTKYYSGIEGKIITLWEWISGSRKKGEDLLLPTCKAELQ